MIYPMERDDDFDLGRIREVDSQINVFQGKLSKFNDHLDGRLKHDTLNLPVPGTWCGY